MSLTHFKVSEPNLVTHLKWTPIFECCMVRCGSGTNTKKTYVLKRLDSFVHNLFIILDIIGRI